MVKYQQITHIRNLTPFTSFRSGFVPFFFSTVLTTETFISILMGAEFPFRLSLAHYWSITYLGCTAPIHSCYTDSSFHSKALIHYLLRDCMTAWEDNILFFFFSGFLFSLFLYVFAHLWYYCQIVQICWKWWTGFSLSINGPI